MDKMRKWCIITLLIAVAAGSVFVRYDDVVPKDAAGRGCERLIAASFTNISPLAIFPCDVKAGKKPAGQSGLIKLGLAQYSRLTIANKLHHKGSTRLSNSDLGGIIPPSLVSLHCLLTV